MNPHPYRWFVAILITPMLFDTQSEAAIDQIHVPAVINSGLNVGANNQVDWGQTFTVGITGDLTGLDVWLSRLPSVVEPLLYDIRTTVAGVPSGPDAGANVLSSGSISATAIVADGGSLGITPERLLHIDLSSEILPVTAGEELALVLRSDGSGNLNGATYQWQASDEQGYLDGRAYLRTGDDSDSWSPRDFDAAFRTYVTPIPEPSTLGMFAGVLTFLSVRTRNLIYLEH